LASTDTVSYYVNTAENGLTFEYRNGPENIGGFGDLFMHFFIKFSDEFDLNNPSTKSPIESITLQFERGKESKVPWKLPKAINSKPDNKGYKEEIDASGCFMIRVDLKQKKVIQVSNMRLVEEEAISNTHVGATFFGVELMDSAIQIGESIFNNALRIQRKKGEDLRSKARKWWKTEAGSVANRSPLLEQYPKRP
jgi:hypothetical protein